MFLSFLFGGVEGKVNDCMDTSFSKIGDLYQHQNFFIELIGIQVIEIFRPGGSNKYFTNFDALINYPK